MTDQPYLGYHAHVGEPMVSRHQLDFALKLEEPCPKCLSKNWALNYISEDGYCCYSCILKIEHIKSQCNTCGYRKCGPCADYVEKEY